ncbi:formin-like protein 14 [Ricinus communis]|uniref:Actin binding protein, putative n=1 Tax=Ricinus communis TaxID=3988 RepID=B9S5R2_RICCO|nr:formin-like protein 14 [Ricinus communis]EEF40999.1 actin binding protein, putative [Ricinus communis]|eukprot:XP_002521331.1 formin-like protein 14 [Ricinus communis]
METRLSTLIFVILGLVCNFLAFLVESQSQNVPASAAFLIVQPPPPPPPPSPPPPSPPPPSPPPPPPPPPPSPSPPPPTSPPSSLLSPPPPSPPPPASSSSPPPPPPPPPSSPPPSPPPPPTPSYTSNTSPPLRPSLRGPSSNGSRNSHGSWTRHNRPPPKNSNHSMNTGKKIGLLFVGIAAILQIGVIGFLVFKRKQLLRVQHRYENCAS